MNLIKLPSRHRHTTSRPLMLPTILNVNEWAGKKHFILSLITRTADEPASYEVKGIRRNKGPALPDSRSQVTTLRG